MRMETPVLEGRLVRLEPLRSKHLDALEKIALDPAIWTYMLAPLSTRQDLEKWLAFALEQEAAGTMMPWATFAKNPDGAEALVGGTRFTDIDMRNRTLEIGNSWITPNWRGTGLNTEAKYLQLHYAFETLGMRRIAFKAHAGNLRSQAAIKGLGATYEGTFRQHYIMSDGTSRDSVWFSILDSEWPEVKQKLEDRLVNNAKR